MSHDLWSPVTPVIQNEFPDVGKTQWKERNDRQLRLWGLQGQARIDAANVLLLNSSSVGAETLKNIVLPGFGKFAIVDHKDVTSKDLGKNFYVTMDAIGGPRAQSVCQNLVELNPDNVQGNYLVEKVATIINEQPQFFDPYNYIVASNLDTQTVMKLGKICQEKNKVLLVCRSYGMIGYIRTYCNSHEVIEGKLDQVVEDLRVTNPWPELQKFCDAHEFDTMDFKTHFHTPYIVLLIKMLKKWRSTKKTDFPTNDSEQEEFKSWLMAEEKNGIAIKEKEMDERAKKQGTIDSFTETIYGSTEEENFKDAYNKIFQAWTPIEIHDDIKAIMNDPRAKDVTTDSTDYWFLIHALNKFVANEGQGLLPLPGNLPDMTSDTERYVKLQSIYRRKAREDMNVIKKYVDEKLEQVGRKAGSIEEYILRDFCKNIHYVRCFHFKSIQDELDPKKVDAEVIRDAMCDSESNMIWYLLLRACDTFNEKYGFYPGRNPKSDTSEEDAGILKVILEELLLSHDVTEIGPNIKDCVAEMVRFGASEIHNISSLIGGVSAQELIKLCTAQRLPFVNTWIFNGMNGTSTVYKL
jgi:amyloid beta precursor protein binding protein 1